MTGRCSRFRAVFLGVLLVVSASTAGAALPTGDAVERAATAAPGTATDESAVGDTVVDAGPAAAADPVTADAARLGVRPASNGTVDVLIEFADFAARNETTVGNRSDVTVTGGWDVAFMPVLFATTNRSAMPGIEAQPGVVDVAVDGTVELPERPAVPNGTVAALSNGTNASTPAEIVPWGIRQTGARRAAADVSASAQGRVKVAVVDTGVDYDHPDLDSNVVWGVDTTNGTTRYGVEAADDVYGHGTSVAGIVAGEDNDRGVVGVAPNASVYSIQVLDASGRGPYSEWVRGMDAALAGPDGTIGTDDDADVLSISLGKDVPSAILERAVERADRHAVVVASAGNSGDGDPYTNEVGYPAKYRESIAVAATNLSRQTAEYSSEGREVDVAAPAVGVRAPAMDGGTRTFGGTSAAAPHVSGAAALLIAADLEDGQRDRSNDQVERRLYDTAVDIESPGDDRKAGTGLLQIDAALNASGPSSVLVANVTEGSGDSLSRATVELVNATSNATVERYRTAFDGNASFLGVRSGGDYRLVARLADESATVAVTDLGNGTTVRRLTLDVNDRFEPNDDVDDAARIGTGNYSGLAVVNQESDVYLVNVSAGDHLVVGVEYDADPGRGLLALSTGSSGTGRYISGTTGAAETFVEANGTASVFVTRSEGSVLGYEMNVSTPAGDRFEPTGVFDSARLADGNYSDLSLVREDRDSYAVVLDAGDRATVDVTFDHDDGDIDLRGNARGEYVTPSVSDTDNESITVTASEPLTYEFDVYADNGSAVPYNLSIQSTGRFANDRFEPNDWIDNATNVSAGTYTGLRIVDGESDYYAVDLERGETVTANATFDHDDLDIDLSIRAPDGDVVELNRSNTDNESASFTAYRDGTHYVEVEGYTGGYIVLNHRSTDETGRYNLTIDAPLNGTSGPPPVVGSDAPTDPDGDGDYEDVDGDGSVTLLDVQALFSHIGDPSVGNNPGAFDFNGDGSVNLLDVQTLFGTATGGSA